MTEVRGTETEILTALWSLMVEQDSKAAPESDSTHEAMQRKYAGGE